MDVSLRGSIGSARDTWRLMDGLDLLECLSGNSGGHFRVGLNAVQLTGYSVLFRVILGILSVKNVFTTELPPVTCKHVKKTERKMKYLNI